MKASFPRWNFQGVEICRWIHFHGTSDWVYISSRWVSLVMAFDELISFFLFAYSFMPSITLCWSEGILASRSSLIRNSQSFDAAYFSSFLGGFLVYDWLFSYYFGVRLISPLITFFVYVAWWGFLGFWTNFINNVLVYPLQWQMKTGWVALCLCLNIGVDPPDVIKISPCARLECWIGI